MALAGTGRGTDHRADGGRVAARGLRYQYMCTLEAILERIADPAAASIRVEGAADGPRVEAVDFDVLGHDGRILLSAQIKSKYRPGATISASVAFGVLLRLVAESDAEAYLLRCAALPGTGAIELAACLGTAASTEDFREDLERTLRKSYGGFPGLSTSTEILQRLRRARLEFDTRAEAEVSADLKHKLRAHRNAASHALGERSAGLLAGFLIGEILRRAADESCASIAMDEIRDLLLVDARDLARAQAVRDWGVLVGPMPLLPDVQRSGPIGQLTAVLGHPAPSGPRRAVLTGLSGIGKSSLAAAYIAEHANCYDVIIWAGAQTDATIRSSFELAATALNLFATSSDASVNDETLRGLVHTGLSRLAGRWAIVFDDATDLRSLVPWLPRLGKGDILVTTINSAPPPTLGHRVPISALEPGESSELLARRFDLDAPQRSVLAEPLADLAAALEHWPLALELAAGYILGCGLPVAGISTYANDVKLRALADEESVPVGYPRTLAAALHMSRDALLARARTLQDSRPFLAVQALYYAAYLAPRQIPIDLIGAAIIIDELEATSPGGQAAGHHGPLIVDVSDFPSGEVIRELRRFSFAMMDEPFSDHLDGLQASNLTIRINTVVQDLLRIGAERNLDAVASSLGSLASHADRWFSAAYEGGDLRRFSDLFAHVDSVARHVVRLGLVGGRIDTLLGNVALGHMLRGDATTSEAIMRYQLHILTTTEVGTPWKITQAQLALASSHCRYPDRTSVALDEAAQLFTSVLQEATALTTEDPEAAAHIAGQAANVLEYKAYREPESALHLREIHESFSRLLTRLEDTAMGKVMQKQRQIEALLASATSDDAAAAEALCRSLLTTTLLNGSMTVVVHRQLIETLVLQGRWSQALETFREFRETFNVELLPLKPVTSMIHNIGARWALTLTSQPSTPPGATALVDEMLAWPISADTTAAHTEPWEARRIDLIRAIHEISNGRPHAARLVLSEIQSDDLVGGPENQTVAWQLLLDEANNLHQAVQAVRPRDAAPPLTPAPNSDPWFDAEYRRNRQTKLSFASLPDLADPDSLPILIPTSLAVYLEYGVDQVPNVDIALTLGEAFAQLGITAVVRTASIKVSDHDAGISGKLGVPSPRWLSDGTFTGHCVLELPDLRRVIAPAIETHPLVRAQQDGPLVLRTVLLSTSTGRIVPNFNGPVGGRATVERGPVSIALDLTKVGLLDREVPYIAERADHYSNAGQDLASATVNLLRDPRWIDKVRTSGNSRLRHLVDTLGQAQAVVDEAGHWSFLIPDPTLGPTSKTLQEL